MEKYTHKYFVSRGTFSCVCVCVCVCFKQGDTKKERMTKNDTHIFQQKTKLKDRHEEVVSC